MPRVSHRWNVNIIVEGGFPRSQVVDQRLFETLCISHPALTKYLIFLVNIYTTRVYTHNVCIALLHSVTKFATVVYFVIGRTATVIVILLLILYSSSHVRTLHHNNNILSGSNPARSYRRYNNILYL